MSREFIYVANVVLANLLACEKDGAIGQVVDMACGGRRTLLDLYRDLTALIVTALQPVFASARAGDVKHSVAAIDQATRALGYKPQVEWRDGLHDTVQWCTNL